MRCGGAWERLSTTGASRRRVWPSNPVGACSSPVRTSLWRAPAKGAPLNSSDKTWRIPLGIAGV